jgi:hypothetical protein
MNDIIEVWQTKIAIPSEIRRSVAKFDTFTDPWLRDSFGVDAARFGGMDALYTDGICDWHDDRHVPNRYSILYVIRNDSGSYIEAKSAISIKEQPVGTMVYLDIWRKHRLWHTKGKRAPLGVYVALCVDMDDKPTSRKQCESLMRKKLKGRCSVRKEPVLS